MLTGTQTGICTEFVHVKRNSPRIVPVTNGALAWTNDRVYELWNFVMTLVLGSFPKLSGTH